MTQPSMDIGVETQARSGGPTVLQPPSQAFNPFIVRKSFEIFDCRYEPVASWCSGIFSFGYNTTCIKNVDLDVFGDDRARHLHAEPQ